MGLIRLPQLGQVGLLGVFIRNPRLWRRAKPLENAPPFVKTRQSEGRTGYRRTPIQSPLPVRLPNLPALDFDAGFLTERFKERLR